MVNYTVEGYAIKDFLQSRMDNGLQPNEEVTIKPTGIKKPFNWLPSEPDGQTLSFDRIHEIEVTVFDS